MPRDKQYESPQSKFHSDACRKAHARQVDPELPAVQVEQAGPPPDPSPQALRSVEISEADYVAQAVARAAAFADRVGETDKPWKLGDEQVTNRKSDRLERARRYAIWRYRGYRLGEVGSL